MNNNPKCTKCSIEAVWTIQTQNLAYWYCRTCKDEVNPVDIKQSLIDSIEFVKLEGLAAWLPTDQVYVAPFSTNIQILKELYSDDAWIMKDLIFNRYYNFGT
jgi:hypothetical protein